MLSSSASFRSYGTFGQAVNDGLDNAFNLVVTRNYNSSQLAGNICAQSYSKEILETNLTANNYIGIAKSTVADTDTATVIVGGVDSQQTSLTLLTTYYVQIDGTISTVADSPSVEAGKAIAATKLLI